MMWSDKVIKEAQEKGRINISPFNESRVQPNSIDLTLDDEVLVYMWSNAHSRFDFIPYSVPDNLARFELPPNTFVLASTKERITLGNGVCAQVDGKSSYGRKGLQIHQTAGFIDAGFSGNITLELYSVGAPILLYAGMPICQLVFWDAYPSEKLYGECGNHYQGQTGVTESWLK